MVHKNTKLTEVLRKEVYRLWEAGEHSVRALARSYHVDKKVVQRVIERGKQGDFSVRNSTNHRYLTNKGELTSVPIPIAEEEG